MTARWPGQDSTQGMSGKNQILFPPASLKVKNALMMRQVPDFNEYKEVVFHITNKHTHSHKHAQTHTETRKRTRTHT